MGIFFVYILKTSVCLAFFYLFYRLLMSEETFHRFNRVALLGLLALSCIVPLVEVSVQEAPVMNQSIVALEEVMMLIPEPDAFVVETPSPFPWRSFLLLVYMAGILFFMARHLWSLARMLRLLHTCRKEKMADGITLFFHREEVAPFSWMKMVVLSEDDWKENGKAILAHERAHITNGHSWDLLLAEVCVFFQWFNPAAWLLKGELQTIHEYEADEWVIRNGIDAKTYQLLLIKKAVGARLYSIANSFNHSSLKKRITMMIKIKSNPWARLKYAYVLPLATVAVAAFARPEVSNQLEEISDAKVNELTSIVEANEVKSVENSSNEKIKVSGQVMEWPSKKPMPGVSIIVRGTHNGAMSDKEGKFTLSVNKGDVLILSYVGMQTLHVPVQGETNLVVWMKEEVQNMEEMVVTGYASVGVGAASSDPGKKVEAVVDIPKGEAPQEEVVFQVVEQMPEFPGGMAECMKFLAHNINYPVAAQQAKIEGRVIVQFVVGRDGSISNVEAIRGVSPELDAEAIRVVSMMPKWNPGKQRGRAVAVKYSMPIMFRLQSPAPAPKDEAEQGFNLKVDKGATQADVDVVKGLVMYGGSDIPVGKGPLVIVDGKEMEKGIDLNSVFSRKDIESISVLKDKASLAMYGDKGKDGVIVIVTNKNGK